MLEQPNQQSMQISPDYFQAVAMREMGYINQIANLRKEVMLLREALDQGQVPKERMMAKEA